MEKNEVKFGLNVKINSKDSKMFITGIDEDGDVTLIEFYNNYGLLIDWETLKDLTISKKQEKRLYRIKRTNGHYVYLFIHNKKLYCTESYGNLSFSKVRKRLLIILNSKTQDEIYEDIFFSSKRIDDETIDIGCFRFKQHNLIRIWNYIAKDHKFIKSIEKIKGIYQ